MDFYDIAICIIFLLQNIDFESLFWQYETHQKLRYVLPQNIIPLQQDKKMS